jgi:predicted DNA-binding protein
MAPEKDTISAEVPADMKQQIRMKAAEEGVTMSQYLRTIIEDHLKRVSEE